MAFVTVKRKMPLLQVKVYSNINNLISPDVKNVCFAGDYKVVFLFFPSQNRKFDNIINTIIFKHCAEIKIKKKAQGHWNYIQLLVTIK